MRRREFITLIGGTAVAWPSVALAQQTSKVWRVGMLDTTPATLNAANIDAFRRGLRQLGYVEGQNLIIEYRSGEGRIERFPELAAEMVRLQANYRSNSRPSLSWLSISRPPRLSDSTYLFIFSSAPTR